MPITTDPHVSGISDKSQALNERPDPLSQVVDGHPLHDTTSSTVIPPTSNTWDIHDGTSSTVPLTSSDGSALSSRSAADGGATRPASVGDHSVAGPPTRINQVGGTSKIPSNVPTKPLHKDIDPTKDLGDHVVEEVHQGRVGLFGAVPPKGELSPAALAAIQLQAMWGELKLHIGVLTRETGGLPSSFKLSPTPDTLEYFGKSASLGATQERPSGPTLV